MLLLGAFDAGLDKFATKPEIKVTNVSRYQNEYNNLIKEI